jgi:hypothetical protein
MPIVGLTDQSPSFPQLGILRKGAPKPKDSNKPGADLKYFRFTADDPEALELFHSAYGPEPIAIRLFLPYQTTDENFEAWREEWTASSLKHRCDGVTCVRWLTREGTYSDERKPCPYISVANGEKGCKQVGRLQVIIPELRRLAYVTVMTTSIHDIIELYSNLKALEAARGDLRGIPLILKRAPRKISTPAADGKRARREKWLITLEAQPSWVDLQLKAQAQAALPVGGQNLLNPAPFLEGDEIEDDEEFQDEPKPVASKPIAAPPVDQGAENKLNALLKGHCLKEKKNEKAAGAYFDALFGKKSFDEKQAAAIKLGLIKAEEPTIEGEVVTDEKDALIQQIEGELFRDLKELGEKPQAVFERIARIAGEAGLDDLDSETLKKVRDGLGAWRDELREGLRKAS